MAGAGTSTGQRESRCTRCNCVIEAGDLRCAVCSLPVPDDDMTVESPIAALLRCTTCGAAVAYDVEVRAPRCPFCDAVAEVERPTDPVERPRWFLPFRTTPDQAQSSLRSWLGSRGFFRPSDLAATASLEALRPLWWVGWVLDARALISWTADSDAGRQRASWAPWAGQNPMDFERILIPASRGLSDDECWSLTDHYDLSTAGERPQGPAGAVCEGFDVQRSAARATIARAIEGLAHSRLASIIPGHSRRNVRVSVLLESLRTRRVALPAYVFTYRYRSKLYRAVVHGQDASCVIGEAPLSLAKIALVVGGAAALLLFLLFVFVIAAAISGG